MKVEQMKKKSLFIKSAVCVLLLVVMYYFGSGNFKKTYSAEGVCYQEKSTGLYAWSTVVREASLFTQIDGVTSATACVAKNVNCGYAAAKANSSNSIASTVVTVPSGLTLSQCCTRIQWSSSGTLCVKTITTGNSSYTYSKGSLSFSGWCALTSGYSILNGTECVKCKTGYVFDSSKGCVSASSSSSVPSSGPSSTTTRPSSSSVPSSSPSSTTTRPSSSSVPSSSPSSTTIKPSSSSVPSSRPSSTTTMSSSSSAEPENPPTGSTAIFLIIIIAIAAICYSVYYFMETKESN